MGLFSFLILLIIVLAGLHLCLPNVLKAILDSSGMNHNNKVVVTKSTAIPYKHIVSISEAVAIYQGLFKHYSLCNVALQVGEDGTYRVNLQHHDEANIRHPYNSWDLSIKTILTYKNLQ